MGDTVLPNDQIQADVIIESGMIGTVGGSFLASSLKLLDWINNDCYEEGV